MTNRLLAAILLLGALAIGFVYYTYAGHPDVGTIQVSKGNVIEGVSLDGTVEAVTHAELGFENVYPAKITKLYAKVGDPVKAGTVIAQMENSDIKAQYDQAVANVSAAHSVLDELNKSVKKEKLKLHDLHSNDKKVQEAQVGIEKKSVDAQEAALLEAQANVRNLEAQLAKSTIRAPFDGIIAKQDVEVGEIANPGVPIVTIIGNQDSFEIQSFVSDQDIAKIKIGDMADVTLDAYGKSTMFKTQIRMIDPGETIQDGIPTHKVTLAFLENDDRIKSGMNANIILKTNEKDGVVEIPEESIINRGDKKIVLVSENGTQHEKEISVGIVGIDHMAEVTSGINVGEYIVK